MDGWLEKEFLKKTPSPKFELDSLLRTFDFGVCQNSPNWRQELYLLIRTDLVLMNLPFQSCFWNCGLVASSIL